MNTTEKKTNESEIFYKKNLSYISVIVIVNDK